MQQIIISSSFVCFITNSAVGNASITYYRTNSGSFQHWLTQYRVDIVLASSPSIVTELGTVFQYWYRPVPQNPVPIYMVQGQFSTVFDPDSRINFQMCRVYIHFPHIVAITVLTLIIRIF